MNAAPAPVPASVPATASAPVPAAASALVPAEMPVLPAGPARTWKLLTSMKGSFILSHSNAGSSLTDSLQAVNLSLSLFSGCVAKAVKADIAALQDGILQLRMRPSRMHSLLS